MGILLACALLSGCVRWQQVDSPAPSVIVERGQVELRDGRVIAVDNLTASNDSLIGLLPNSSSPGHPLQRFAVGQADVTAVYERQGSLSRTIAVATLPVVLLLGSIYLLGY